MESIKNCGIGFMHYLFDFQFMFDFGFINLDFNIVILVIVSGKEDRGSIVIDKAFGNVGGMERTLRERQETVGPGDRDGLRVEDF